MFRQRTSCAVYRPLIILAACLLLIPSQFESQADEPVRCGRNCLELPGLWLFGRLVKRLARSDYRSALHRRIRFAKLVDDRARARWSLFGILCRAQWQAILFDSLC